VRPLVAALLMTAACGGQPANQAVAVAERFLDLYFVEIDQEKALPLTVGLAHEALEKELRDVAGVRAGGYSPADATGKAYYQRTYLKEDASAGTARLIYNLTMEYGRERDTTQRHVLLSLRKDEGRWKVASFIVREGPASRVQ
jgi:hypothetical protein